MIKKNILLCLFILSFVIVSFGQDKQVTNEEFKFNIALPNDLVVLESGSTIFEFRGTEKNHGEDSLFFLKSIMIVNISPIEKVEAYMKEPTTVENMNNDFINAMKGGFPDTKSTEKSFILFNDRPSIQGTYSFTVRDVSMTGRYVLLLVKEQSSIYVFSWTSKTNTFESWNKISESAVKSLKIIPQK